MLKVRITDDNVKSLRYYQKRAWPRPSIPVIVNYAVQKFLIEESDNAEKIKPLRK